VAAFRGYGFPAWPPGATWPGMPASGPSRARPDPPACGRCSARRPAARTAPAPGASDPWAIHHLAESPAAVRSGV